MKILQLNSSDIQGGAARAAYRIHQAINNFYPTIESKMLVGVKSSDDYTVSELREGVAGRIRPRLAKGFTNFMDTKNPVTHSPGLLPSKVVNKINNSNFDIVNIHSIHGDLLSIAEIGKIQKPIVWTLHDMWLFSGAEHYSDEFRWRDGYHSKNRPNYESGFDLNKWVWLKKKKCWKNINLTVVAPSNWMANLVRESKLLHQAPVEIIPNPINLDKWRPIDQLTSRKLLSLPTDVSILLFGAMGGRSDVRKGFDLLKASLDILKANTPNIHLLIFGESPPKNDIDFGFPVHYVGHLFDDISLDILYSAADVMLIPSRQDNLPNTGIEALACGLPVVSFNIGGLPDIVTHLETGYLATPFSIIDFASGINWILNHPNRAVLKESCRKKSISYWSYDVVAEKYMNLYMKLVARDE